VIALRLIGTPPNRLVMGAVVTLLALLVAAGLAGTARADIPTSGDFAPSVWSDKADYSPGETVSLSGANWQPGESVHLRVNDDAGSTWSRDVDITADDAGAIADSFALPDWFVAKYSVTATGASGSKATASFTDANLKVDGSFVGSTTDSYTLSYKRWSGSGCGGTARTGDPLTGSVTTAPFTVQQSGQTSVTLTAAVSSAGGRQFLNWKDSSGSVISTNPSVCLDYPGGGTEKTYTASYGAGNAAPTVSANTGTVAVNEGQTATNTGAYSDANSGDSVSITASRGTITKTGTNSGSWSWSLGTTDGPGDTGPVTITANDGNGGVTTTSFTLNVANVAPTVAFAAGNLTTVNEGAAQRTYSYTISDPGADTVSSVTTGCGANGVKVAGSDTNTNTTGSFKCTFADGPATSVVSATATDSDNAAGNLATQAVTVDNVAPSVTLSGPATANEGDTKTYNFTVADPGQDSFAADAGFPDCDAGATNNGTFVAGSLSLTPTGGSFQCSFADGPSTANVKMGVRDSDGAADSSTQSVQIVAVANVNPTVTAPANQSANEGASTAINLGSFSDPGPDSPWAVDVDWGDGSAHATFNMTATGSLGSLNHTYADGPATRTVSVKVTDKNGGSETRSFSVSVANVAPTITTDPSNPNDLSVDEGSTHTYSYLISDPGQDAITAVTTSCGANGTKVAGSDTHTDTKGSFKCSFSDGPASSTLTATATDDDGATGGVASQAVAVANVAATVTLSGGNDVSAAEGSTHTYSYAISDPGQDTVQSVQTDCGANSTKVAGSDTNTDTTGSFRCTFPDGPASSTVSASAKDSDGAQGATDNQGVTVSNVAPSVSVSGPATADEGSTKTYAFTITDPGDDTFALDAGYPDCDAGATSNGTFVAGSLSLTPTGGSVRCSFADGPSSADVKVKVLDSDGAADVSTQSVQIVAVANVAPTVTAPPADQDADEGASTAISLGSFSDRGPDAPWAVDVDWGDGSTHATFDSTLTGSLGSLSHTFDDGPAVRTVSVKVTDGDGGSDTKTFTVEVANVAPTVTLSAANDLSVGEGSTHTYSYDISDRGRDTVQSVSTSCGDDATKVAGSDEHTDTRGSFECSFPDGPASSTVSARATDSDGDEGAADTQSVDAANVAPTVTLSATNDQSVSEGSTATYGYSIADPGQDAVASVDTSCGAHGTKTSATNTDTSGSFTCSFADGPATSVVSASATDSDGAAGNLATQTVTVKNVAPKVTLAGANVLAVDEGSTHTYDYSIADAGQDTVQSVATSCGANGVKLAGSDSHDNSSGSFRCRFPDGPASSSVTASATDSDGATGAEAAQSVAVANVAPTVHVSGDPSVDEGTTHTYAFTVSDPGGDTFAASTGSPDCDAGATDHGTLVEGSYAATATGGSFDCTFPDGPTTANVKMKVADSDGASGTDSESVQIVAVANVSPTVTAAADQAAYEGAAQSFDLGSFIDPGPDSPWAVDVDWGDGSAHTTFDADSAGALSGRSHTYADGPATRTVTVEVTDENGGADSETFQVVVANVAPKVILSAANDRSVDEGSTSTYAYTISDPGQDTVQSVSTSCGDNGSKVDDSDTHTDTTGSFTCSFPDGPASSTVSARATDSDGAQGAADTQSVSVDNVAPKVTLSAANDLSVAEGSAHTYSYSISDPGQDTVAAVDTPCGGNGTKAGAESHSNAGGLFECHFADGQASSTVSARATDSDADQGAADTQSISVANVAPKVTLSAANDLSVAEGSAHTYSYSISDPGQDTVDAVDTSCGDDGVKVGSEANSNSSGSFECRFPDGPSSSTVSASATDSDGATGASDSQDVTVANVAPTVHLAGAGSVDEGSTHTYTFTVGDPGDDGFDPASGYPDCDVASSDNGTLEAGSYAVTASGGSFKCSFPDGPSTAKVAMKVVDSDGASGTDSESVQVVDVANAAPTLTAPAGQDADEGASTDVSLGSFSDPGPDAPWSVDVDWGDGSAHTRFTTSSTGALGTKPHTYTDGPATRSVSVKVTDKNGGSDTKSFQVAVANVAPKVTLSAANDLSAGEGTTHTYIYSIFDPGQDTVQSVATSCGGNGSKVDGSDSHGDSSGSFECRFPDGPASSNVSARATDSDDDEGAADTQTVSVANVAPKVVLTGPGSVDEGMTRTYSFTVSDPGDDTFVAASGHPDCDAGATNNGTYVVGSYAPSASGGSFKCSFPDGPSTANVKMSVFDSDNAGGTDSESVQVVEVANVAPTLTAPANQSADEGTAKSIDLGSLTDPGPDAPWAVDVDWGDGSAHTTFSASSTGALGTKDHTYADGPATRTVSVKVTDKNGGSDSKTFEVAVANVPPKVTLSTANDLSVDEGTTHTYGYAISDPGQDIVQSVQVSCGGRGSVVPGSSTNDNGSGSFQCSFADGLSPATATTVSVSAKDSNGDTGTADTQSVTVKNFAPTATAPADQTANEGSPQTFSLGSFGDPGQDSPWKVSVAWGDGSAPQSAADRTATGSLGTAAHTYADNGTYTVGVTVTDKDGGAATKTFKVAIANVAPKITRFTGTDYIVGANAFLDGTNALKSTLTTEFTDPGSDTWTGLFNYTDGSPLTETISGFTSGSTRSHAFASPGCKTATVKVTDDEGGSDTASTPVQVSTGAFQPPMTNQPVTDKLKNGQVLPVKVHVNDCAGSPVTTLTPAIRLVKGDLTPQSDDATVAITPTSSSAADTTGVMRSAGGGDYIYNMQVNLPQMNADYTVVVYPYGTSSPMELGHVIQATK
jgi:hypothetical protein